MWRRILMLSCLVAGCAFAADEGADWVYLQGDKDTVKLLWTPPQWFPELSGFNVKRRVPAGAWVTLNTRPILPTVYEADIDSRTNDPALREELRTFRAKVRTSIPLEEKPLEQVLRELGESERYERTLDPVKGDYKLALILGFAYQDAAVPKGNTYEYGLFAIARDGTERPEPIAVRRWKWGSVPSLTLRFGSPVLEREPGERYMRVKWPLPIEDFDRHQVRVLRVYAISEGGTESLWSRKYKPHHWGETAVIVKLQGLVESGVFTIHVVPVNYFGFEGTPSPPVSYEWAKYREVLLRQDPAPGPATIQDVTDRPPAPAPPPPPSPSPAPVRREPVDARTLLGTASMWFDASEGVSLDDRRVAAWRDKSGNGFIATMKEPQRRPFVVSVEGGVAALRFDGAQSLHLERPLELHVGTIIIVGRSGGDQTRNIILGPVGNNKNNQLLWEDPENMMIVGPSHGSRIVKLPVGGTGSMHVVAVRYDGSRVSFWRDDRTNLAYKFGKAPDEGYSFNSIGSYYSQMYLVGEIAAIIVLPQPLGPAEMKAVDSRLRERYRIR